MGLEKQFSQLKEEKEMNKRISAIISKVSKLESTFNSLQILTKAFCSEVENKKEKRYKRKVKKSFKTSIIRIRYSDFNRKMIILN